METVIIKFNKRTDAGKAIDALLKNLKDKDGVEIITDESPYNPEFVEKIRRAEKQEGIVIDTNDIWGSIGLK